jgi:hypothetical protein
MEQCMFLAATPPPWQSAHKHSTLAQWQESAGSMTPTCKSTQMVYLSGISEYRKLTKGCHWQVNS